MLFGGFNDSSLNLHASCHIHIWNLPSGACRRNLGLLQFDLVASHLALYGHNPGVSRTIYYTLTTCSPGVTSYSLSLVADFEPSRIVQTVCKASVSRMAGALVLSNLPFVDSFSLQKGEHLTMLSDFLGRTHTDQRPTSDQRPMMSITAQLFHKFGYHDGDMVIEGTLCAEGWGCIDLKRECAALVDEATARQAVQRWARHAIKKIWFRRSSSNVTTYSNKILTAGVAPMIDAPVLQTGQDEDEAVAAPPSKLCLVCYYIATFFTNPCQTIHECCSKKCCNFTDKDDVNKDTQRRLQARQRAIQTRLMFESTTDVSSTRSTGRGLATSSLATSGGSELE